MNYVPYLRHSSFPCDRFVFFYSKFSLQYSSLTFIAAQKGYSHIVELLINNGAHFYKEEMCGWKPLHAAVKKGSLKSVELLMTKTDSSLDSMFGFHLAAIFNHSDVLKRFLENGEKDECIPCKKKYRDPSDVINPYFKYFCGSVLNIAVDKKNQKMVKMLLSKSKETLECKSLAGLTPLMQAVEKNDSGMVTLLLDEGADVEAQCEAKSRDERFHIHIFLIHMFFTEHYYCSCTSKAIHIR